MGTIEERAKEYAQAIYGYAPAIEIAFIRGARSEHEALTRWRDPKEELPQERRDVEVKTDKGKVSVCNMSLDERGRRFWNVSRTDYMIPDANIIGWREIHE